jgi:hypothetical protein
VGGFFLAGCCLSELYNYVLLCFLFCFALFMCVGVFCWEGGFCFFVFFIVLFSSYFAFVLFLSSRIVFFNHFEEFCHCSVYICMDSKDTLIEKSVCDCW